MGQLTGMDTSSAIGEAVCINLGADHGCVMGRDHCPIFISRTGPSKPEGTNGEFLVK